MYREDIERMKEIRDEIAELVEEARNLIPREGGTKARAESYWVGHIQIALGGEPSSRWASGSMCSMTDTIEEMRRELEEGEKEG